MGITVTVTGAQPRNLIGMRAERQADGSLRFLPTRRGLRQRIALALFLAVPGILLLGFTLMLQSASPRSPESAGQSLLALRGIQLLGGLLLLCALLSVLGGFRKRATFLIDRPGNLVFTFRGLTSRRESFALPSFQSIQYGVRRQTIGRVPVGEVNPKWPREPAATVWVWSVTLRAGPMTPHGEPSGITFDVASQDSPPQSGYMPDEVALLCAWLRDTTGKPLLAQ